MLKDSDGAGDSEPLNSDESSLSGEAAVSTPSSKGNKPEEIVVASLRKLPCKTMLTLIRTHPHLPFLLLDLQLDSSTSRPLKVM